MNTTQAATEKERIKFKFKFMTVESKEYANIAVIKIVALFIYLFINKFTLR